MMTRVELLVANIDGLRADIDGTWTILTDEPLAPYERAAELHAILNLVQATRAMREERALEEARAIVLVASLAP